MERLVGTAYVWGGNWSKGISDLLLLYPPSGVLDKSTHILWTLKGVDCSGLLYQTTRGLTPRNTKELVHFGSNISIEGKELQELLSLLLPMDMIVWPGHVWFVFDHFFSIESKSPFGVIKRPLNQRLEETLCTRKGVNEWNSSLDPRCHFVIRRLGFIA
jgi:hypothetical protein